MNSGPAAGRRYFHVHDHDGVEDDDDVLFGADEAAEIGPDRVPDQLQLATAAVHVGAANVHFLVSRLTMRRLGVALMSRYEVVAREELYRSPRWPTPYAANGELDVARVERILVDGFADAGRAADELHTRLILLSGPAAGAEAALGRALPGFVCTSAAAGARAGAGELGLSQFDVQVSGDTVFLSSGTATPQRNLPVVPVELHDLGDELSAEDVRDAIRAGLAEAGHDERRVAVALHLHWAGRPYFRTLTAIAEGVAGAQQFLPEAGAVVVTLTQDCARSLGRALREAVPPELEVVCIDGLQLAEHDFIDVGHPIHDGLVVPVVVKSLVFAESQQTRRAVDG